MGANATGTQKRMGHLERGITTLTRAQGRA